MRRRVVGCHAAVGGADSLAKAASQFAIAGSQGISIQGGTDSRGCRTADGDRSHNTGATASIAATGQLPE